MTTAAFNGVPASVGSGTGFWVTVGELFCEQALLGPTRPALEDGGQVWTFAELNDRVNRLVHAMAARGLSRHDRVAVLSENRHEFIEVMLASAKLGVLVACQNWRLADAEQKHCLTLADPKIIFCSERLAPAVARLDHGVPTVLTFGPEYEQMLARSEAREPPPVAEPEDGFIIIYTSGTTGLPKGAVISQRAEIMRAVIARIEPVPTTRDDGYIAWAPMFHLGGSEGTMTALLRGAKTVIMDGFNAEQMVTIAAREQVGHLTVLPGMVDRVIDTLKATGLRPKSVRSVGVLPDLVPPNRIAEITSLVGAPYCNSFGASECGWPPASKGIIPIGVVPTRLSKEQNSFGRIRLVDEDDNEVPVGQSGEVTFRGPTLFSGYWRAPEVNAHEFRGGWFHLGDVLRRNEDGTFDFVDRRKYMIKSGAENIYPAEIERVLIALPGVADVVVVRKPDPRWGEVPVAFVVREPGATLTSEQAIAACQGQIARYKVPKEIRFIAEKDLQRSTTGKIMRQDLEALLKREIAEAAANAPPAAV